MKSTPASLLLGLLLLAGPAFAAEGPSAITVRSCCRRKSPPFPSKSPN
jgi:hypothetical protein